MMCAKCMKPLERIHGTAYIACCSKGYWMQGEPLPRDSWHPVRRYRGHTLYTPTPSVPDYDGGRCPV